MRAVEFKRDAIERTRGAVLTLLFAHGFDERSAVALLRRGWFEATSF